MLKVFIEGLKVGFMFQIIIGPICFYLFQVSITYGFIAGISGAIGVSLADLLFIVLAILGVDKILKKFPSFRRTSAFIGMIILILFGIYFIAQSIFYTAQSQHSIAPNQNVKIFIDTVILTLSNPITILYWSGSFSIIAAKYHAKNELCALGFGAFITTPTFFVFWVAFSAFFGTFLSQEAIKILRFAIGIVLIIYGIRLYIKNKDFIE